ncbi:MAG: magnesium transporter CorA family protein [Lentisphaerae bacterium]|nr:magnesium transporter CorA family protein [Lentisphaerota bacterium]
MKRYDLIDTKVCEAGEGKPGRIVVYINPDEAEKKSLIDDYKLDEHTLNSTFDPDEISRLEFEPDHVAMIFKRPKNYSSKDHFMFKVASLGLYLFQDRLIVLLNDDIQMFSGKTFARCASLLDVSLRLIAWVIFHFMEHLKVINMITDSLEHKINTSMENKHLLNLFTLEKSLVYYLAAINSNMMLINKIKNSAAKLGMTPENGELLDDILIENTQCMRQAEIYSNILASMMDARASIISNNINVLMKTLNIITIGIMVPTLVVSIFSMNVLLPLNKDHPAMFWVIISLCIASTVAFFAFWKRRSDRQFHARG